MITQQPIRLATGVEMLTGPNDIPLLYVGARKSYLRLSATGAALIQRLQEQGAMTQPELLAGLSESSQNIAANTEITHFFQQLFEAGVLEIEGQVATPQVSLSKRIRQRITARPRLELPLWRPDRVLFAQALQTLHARAGHWLSKFIGLSFALAIVAITYAAIAPQTAGHINVQTALFSLGLLLLHTAGHEMAHALVSSYYGIKVREFGVALLYYFIPVAYTDRTDAYRLREFRARAYIAFAGPAFDLFATAASAVIASTTSGRIANVFQTLMWVQLAGFLSNLNPLLPGDAYHIAEAWCGALNFRGRAFTLFWRRLTWRGLPPHLQRLTAREQWFHFGYAALSSLYVLSLAWGALHFVMIRLTLPPQ